MSSITRGQQGVLDAIEGQRVLQPQPELMATQAVVRRAVHAPLAQDVAQAKIALAQDGSVQRPGGVFLPRGPLTSHQAKTLLEVGGRLVAEDLRPFQTAINQLGAPILTFDRLVTLLEQAMAQQVPGEVQVEAERLESFYRPLWSMVNDLLPDIASTHPGSHPSATILAAGIAAVIGSSCYDSPRKRG